MIFYFLRGDKCATSSPAYLFAIRGRRKTSGERNGEYAECKVIISGKVSLGDGEGMQNLAFWRFLEQKMLKILCKKIQNE